MVVRGVGIDPWATQFPDNLLHTVFELIFNSWNSFKLPEDRRENSITRRFCAQLRSNKNRSRLCFNIHLEEHEIDEEGELLGRIDLSIRHGYNEEVYYSLECKRLRFVDSSGQLRHLAVEYVTDGMIRYFNGQYAVGLNKAAMLGYVMDGDVSKAITQVKVAIEGKRKELHMSPDQTLITCYEFNQPNQLKETNHNYGPDSKFIIHHVFLPAH